MAPGENAEIAAASHFMGQQQKDKLNPEWVSTSFHSSFAAESCKPNRMAE